MSGPPSKTKDLDQVKVLWLQDALLKYLIDLGVECLSDLVNLVDAKAAEELLSSLVLEQSPEKGKPIQLSHLRSAATRTEEAPGP